MRINQNQQQSQGKKRLSPENQELQKAKASCYMVIKFKDGRTWSRWSNEHKQPWILNIGDGINEMFRVFDKYFLHSAESAAIFDTRVDKKPGKHNKIYQYDKGWKLVQPVAPW